MEWTFEGRQVGVTVTEALVKKTQIWTFIWSERLQKSLNWERMYRQTSPSSGRADLGKGD